MSTRLTHADTLRACLPESPLKAAGVLCLYQAAAGLPGHLTADHRVGLPGARIAGQEGALAPP